MMAAESAAGSADFWRGKRVILTGHTGFKGGWLGLWLDRLGASVLGLGLPPDTHPSFFETARVTRHLDSRMVDIRALPELARIVAAFDPEIVFHLAAKSLVHRAYANPVETFSTNVAGTWNLLEACRGSPNLSAVVIVTSDKVYRNNEWVWPCRETDPLGGNDPYSASKAAAEMVSRGYARSYFTERGIPVVTARGGNVIGGGDWAENRLVPDLFRALRAGERVAIRSPEAIRPWQHVLALCHGYLSLAEAVCVDRTFEETEWNFGPASEDCLTVAELLNAFARAGVSVDITTDAGSWKPETRYLSLDSSRARRKLGWRPALDLHEAVAWTAAWYVAEAGGADMETMADAQIADYEDRAGRRR